MTFDKAAASIINGGVLMLELFSESRDTLFEDCPAQTWRAPMLGPRSRSPCPDRNSWC